MPKTQFFISKGRLTFQAGGKGEWTLPAHSLIRLIKVADKSTNSYYIQSLADKKIEFYTSSIELLSLTEVQPSEMLAILYG